MKVSKIFRGVSHIPPRFHSAKLGSLKTFYPAMALLVTLDHSCFSVCEATQGFQLLEFCSQLRTPETHGETGVCPPKTIPESNAKMLILLFYVLKRCFSGIALGGQDPVSP